MLCPFCGKSVPDDATFCTSCGRELPKAKPSDQKDQIPVSNQKMLKQYSYSKKECMYKKIGVGVMIALIGILFIVSVVMRSTGFLLFLPIFVLAIIIYIFEMRAIQSVHLNVTESGIYGMGNSVSFIPVRKNVSMTFREITAIESIEKKMEIQVFRGEEKYAFPIGESPAETEEIAKELNEILSQYSK